MVANKTQNKLQQNKAKTRTAPRNKRAGPKRCTRTREDPANWARKVNKNSGVDRGKGGYGGKGGQRRPEELEPPSLLAKLAMTATSQVAAIVWLTGRFGWLDVLRPADVHMNATSGASGSDPIPPMAMGMSIESSSPALECFTLLLPIEPRKRASAIRMPQVNTCPTLGEIAALRESQI